MSSSFIGTYGTLFIGPGGYISLGTKSCSEDSTLSLYNKTCLEKKNYNETYIHALASNFCWLLKIGKWLNEGTTLNLPLIYPIFFYGLGVKISNCELGCLMLIILLAKLYV